MDRYLLVTALLFIAACATSGALPPASLAEDDGVCRREIPPGSRLAVRVCRSRSEMAQRQEADKEWLEEIREKGNTAGSNFR